MARKSASKAGMEAPKGDEVAILDDPRLPNKSLFRVGEAAYYLGYSEATIRMWIADGILEAEKHNREFRIAREVILGFRAKSKFRPLEEGL